MTARRYNPADPENLGASVADALLREAPEPLGGIHSFTGAGIYAIYYVGPFPCYDALVSANLGGRFARPIYVGKAEREGRRKGAVGSGEYTGTALFRRLSEHADSIRSANNLDIKDFFCRYLIVHDIYVPLVEGMLIARFSPVWNTLIDGFGNHDPGAGRYKGFCPRWDVLHPGRPWATKCRHRPETEEQIAVEVVSYLTVAPNGTNLDGNGNSATPVQGR